ncbi:MAG TPA: hypothetical protein VI643_05600, partial [Planctomycetota bacterium]|nr:hypothetical protein [Planctomycetota bacterium]
ALGAEVTNIYSKMRRAQREGGILTDAQNQEVQNLEKILEEFFEGGLFKADDSFNTLIRKYGVLAEFYAAKSGPEAATAELLKPEVPQGRRRHEARKGAAPDLDWRWMRLSPFAYSHAAGDFLDEKYKGADGPKQAAAIIRAMEAALPEIRKQGSLGPVEFMVLDLKLVRGCLEMDEAAIREVFDEMKRQAWGQLYETLAGTLGRTARHMKPEDFTRVFNLFCDSKVPRRHYYGVVYPAYQSGALEPAVAASRICIERFPNDADMRREHELLLKLATPK